MEETLETCYIAAHDLLEITNRPICRKKQAEHPPHSGGFQGNAVGLGAFRQAIGQPLCHVLQPFEKAGLTQNVQGGEPRAHGNGIARQRAGLIDRAIRGELIHEVGPPAEGADRHPATDHLAQGGEIGPYAVARLGTPQRHPEPGHHLIEDQQAGIFIAQGPQARQKSRYRRHTIHVARHRLDDHRSDLPAQLRKRLAHTGEVVVAQGERLRRQRRRHAG